MSSAKTTATAAAVAKNIKNLRGHNFCIDLLMDNRKMFIGVVSAAEFWLWSDHKGVDDDSEIPLQTIEQWMPAHQLES